MKYEPQRVIAIDVDGTLLQADGRADKKVIAWCRQKKKDGYQLILWSAAGEAHARAAAERCELLELFAHIVSKPGYILDDVGWDWIRFTGVARPQEL